MRYDEMTRRRRYCLESCDVCVVVEKKPREIVKICYVLSRDSSPMNGRKGFMVGRVGVGSEYTVRTIYLT